MKQEVKTKEGKIGINKTRNMINSGNKILSSFQLTSFFSQERNQTIVTLLFWADGTVTWTEEE